MRLIESSSAQDSSDGIQHIIHHTSPHYWDTTDTPRLGWGRGRALASLHPLYPHPSPGATASAQGVFALPPASRGRVAACRAGKEKDLHTLTRTFRRPGGLALNLRTHLARDIRDLRRILHAAGYAHATMNRQLQELIRQNKTLGGFAK